MGFSTTLHRRALNICADTPKGMLSSIHHQFMPPSRAAHTAPQSTPRYIQCNITAARTSGKPILSMYFRACFTK